MSANDQTKVLALLLSNSICAIGKLLEKDVLDVEAGANVGSHSNEVQAEEIHQNDHSRAQKQKAVENIYM